MCPSCEGNLAYKTKNARQSSTLWGQSVYGADKAVDGNIGLKQDGGHCSHTKRGYDSYLRVNLGEPAYIINVTIYNRKSNAGKFCN